MQADLIAARKQRLAEALEAAEFDAFLAVSPANVDYATGYRSVSGAVHGRSGIGVFVGATRTVLAGPVADSAPALADGIAEEDYVAYGRFYFESRDGNAAPTRMVDAHADLVDAMRAAALLAGLGSATIGVDEAALRPTDRARLAEALPGATFVDASGWALKVRSRKLPGELDLLERGARLAEDGVTAALAQAAVGVTERELAKVIAQTMAAGGAMPKFVVVTSGERAALADAFATDRKLAPGDLVRFDIGGDLDGYWSDIGRTAVVGEASPTQKRLYDAIFAGEEEQLQRIRPGMAASEVFDIAITEVERHGLFPYRRHHCGHGIGLDVYEPPIVAPGVSQEIEAGMVFCLETPYYEIGWGGMMVEDTIVVTEDGHRMFNVSDRSLRVIPA
jgi:Xaa-Pro aminopeptidase